MKSFLKKITLTIPFLLLSIFSVVPNLCLNNTLLFKLDEFAFHLINYNKSSFNENEKNPILNVTKTFTNEQIFYTDIFEELKFTLITDSIRQQIATRCTVTVDSEELPIKLQYQSTYSISNNKNKYNSYNVDHNFATAYYPPSQLPDYLKARNGADTYVFVSDKFADKLINKYGLEKKNYLSLINDDKRNKLDIKCGDSTTITASINNVLHSEETNYQKNITSIYGDYAYIYLPYKIRNKLNYEFEVDLKASPFSIKEVVKKIAKHGYFENNSRIALKTFNTSSNSYQYDLNLSNELSSINFKSNDTLWYCFYALLTLVGVCSFIVSLKLIKTKNRWNLIMIAFNLVVAITISVLLCFYYFYYLWSVPYICLLISYFVVNRKGVKSCLKHLIRKPQK